MNYHNPIYGIFNEANIQEQIRQQQLQQFHYNQLFKTYDCANKLKDFLESAEEVSPQYRDIAALQCYAVLGDYFKEKKTSVLY